MAGDDSPGGVDAAALNRDFLFESHVKVQQIMLWAVAPMTAITYLIQYVQQPVWQLAVCLAVSVLAAISWLVAYRLTILHKQLELSVWILVISVMAMIGISALVAKGTETTSIMSLVALIIYGSTFSRRILYTSTTVTLVMFLLVETVHFYEPFEIHELPGKSALVSKLLFGCLVMPIVAFLLHRNRAAADRILDAVRDESDKRAMIIETVSNTSRTLTAVVDQIQEVTSRFASQASELSAITTQVATATEELRRAAVRTREATDQTKRLALETRDASQQGSLRVKAVEEDFRKVIERNQVVTAQFSALLGAAGKIEQIVNQNAAVGNQIKILAVNAAIEGAQAGERGLGFQAVAEELRRLIGLTDSGLRDSRALLESITTQGRHGADTLSESSKMLQNQHGALGSTAELVGMVTGRFSETADQVEEISTSAVSQQRMLDDVSQSMHQVDEATTDLNESVTSLLETVERIRRSQQRMRAALGEQS